MASFDIFYPILLKKEGGYANDPDDKGGETYVGVARNFHPNLSLWLLVDAHVQRLGGKNKVRNNTKFVDPGLDRLIKTFYLNTFWVSGGFGAIQNQSIANILADWKINGGFGGKLVRELQELVKTPADGVWGVESSKALNQYAKTKVKSEEVFAKIKELRERTFRASGSWWKHGTGWMTRLNSFKLVFNKRNAWIVGGVALCVVSITAYWVYSSKNQKKTIA